MPPVVARAAQADYDDVGAPAKSVEWSSGAIPPPGGVALACYIDVAALIHRYSVAVVLTRSSVESVPLISGINDQRVARVVGPQAEPHLAFL